MKKLAILFVPLVLVFQLPLCPYRYLPQDWVNTYEYGKKWTRVLMSLYLDSLTRNGDTEKRAHKAFVDANGKVVNVRFDTSSAQWNVETRVRILRFELPREQASFRPQFRTRCQRL